MYDHFINIHLSELLCTKTKETRINEYKKNKNKNGQFRVCLVTVFSSYFLFSKTIFYF